MLHRNRIILFGAGTLAILALPLLASWDARDTGNLDARIASAGDRLATANVPLCENRAVQLGLMVHDLSQYSRAARAEVIAAFDLDEGPGVLALAEGGAAARAGLRVNDVLLSADGADLPRPAPHVHDSFAPTERIIETIEAAFADGVADLRVRRRGTEQVIRVRGTVGCASRFQMVPSAQREAKADGKYVQLTSALVEYTKDDHELAALIAHELAHNILRHRARLNAAGVDREAPTLSPRDARLFQATELEADRLAIHLMHRAGYDAQAAVRLWTRQSKEPREPARGMHPEWSTRIAAMQEEIAAIAAAAARGEQAPAPLPS